MEHLSTISSFFGGLSVGNTAFRVMDDAAKPSGPVTEGVADSRVLSALEGCEQFRSHPRVGTAPAPLYSAAAWGLRHGA